MEIVVLLMLAVLSGAVLHLFASQRKYQQVDYSAMLEQERYARALDDRIAYLESLIAEQQQLVQASEADWRQVQAAMEKLKRAQEAAPRQGQSDRVVPAQPSAAVFDLAELQRQLNAAPPEGSREVPPAAPLSNSSRRAAIAAQLSSGQSAADAARVTGASRHEVELVKSMLGMGDRAA